MRSPNPVPRILLVAPRTAFPSEGAEPCGGGFRAGTDDGRSRLDFDLPGGGCLPGPAPGLPATVGRHHPEKVHRLHAAADFAVLPHPEHLPGHAHGSPPEVKQVPAPQAVCR